MRKTRTTYLNENQVTIILEKMKTKWPVSSAECGGVKPIHTPSDTVTNLQTPVVSGETAPGPDFREARIFDFNSNPVRIVPINGEPWWVAKDVAEALGYVWNGTKRIEHVPEEWRRLTSVVTLRGDLQDMACLAEQGLYFFLARSDKPLAFPFQKWIAGEVIPSIRKTGGYNVRGYTPEKTALDHRLVSALNKSVQIGAITPGQFRSVLNIPPEAAV
jgi:prophage antirepressor-like protein